MKLRLPGFIKNARRQCYIRRGSVTGQKVCVNTDGTPRQFLLLISLSSNSTDFAQRYSTNNTTFGILAQPEIEDIRFQGDTADTELRRDDQIVVINAMDRTPIMDSESAQDHLIREIKDTQKGVITITIIRSDYEAQVIEGTDITGSIGIT